MYLAKPKRYSMLKKIQGVLKDRLGGRTFQGLYLKFKDFSRPCAP